MAGDVAKFLAPSGFWGGDPAALIGQPKAEVFDDRGRIVLGGRPGVPWENGAGRWFQHFVLRMLCRGGASVVGYDRSKVPMGNTGSSRTLSER